MRQWILLFFIAQVSIVKAQSTPLMASIEINLAENQQLPLADTISFKLASPQAAAIAAKMQDWQHLNASQIDDETLLVTMNIMPQYSGEVKKQHLASSFVIDNNEPSTQQFIQDFKINLSPEWGLEELVGYVHQFISQPTYIHGFSIASVVANQRSGDCTEFAVLTTALARAMNIPARMIIGTVLLEDNAQISAFGHAWTEVYLDDKWQVIDAALFGSKAKQHFYLPAGALDNEGPGYVLSLATATNLMPLKMTHLRSFE
jgi:transglutaminase/protease-like cytokinesis protein 3